MYIKLSLIFFMVHAVILFVGGFAGQIHAQLFQGIGIDAGEDDGGMDIAALQVGGSAPSPWRRTRFPKTELESAIRISSVCRRGFCCRGRSFSASGSVRSHGRTRGRSPDRCPQAFSVRSAARRRPHQAAGRFCLPRSCHRPVQSQRQAARRSHRNRHGRASRLRAPPSAMPA